jgi:protein phosphatase 1 regulatory subunit 42
MAAQKYELVAQQQSIRQQQEKLEILRRQLAASLASLNLASAPQVVAAPMHHQRAAPTLNELPAMHSFDELPAMHCSQLHHRAPAANNAGCLHRQKESENTSTEVTLMMGSLSSKYTQPSLLEEIDMHGFAGTYDFFYLPIDAATKTNRAYAFINFTSGEAAKRFQEIFNGLKMRLPNSSKCTTVKVAALQGFEANHAHFANSRVANRGNVHSRPLFLREVMSSRSFNPVKKSRNAAVRAGKYAQSKAVMQETAPAPPIKKAHGTRETSFCPFCGVPKGATFQFCVNCRAAY